MPKLYEIAFKGDRRELFDNSLEIPIEVGDYVIVEADRGEDLGYVVRIGDFPNRNLETEQVHEILRKANDEEITLLTEKRKREAVAFLVCKVKVASHKLDMKVVGVEHQFDGNKITFYFTSDSRVDFRELVRELAAIYKTRIELRQIGPRDEARRAGDCGICGKQICCTVFIEKFEPIATQTLKLQNLALNPSKVTGVCGRLMCCLRYEQVFYQDAAGRFPKAGTKIVHCTKCQYVVKSDIFREKIFLRDEEGAETKMSLSEFEKYKEFIEIPKEETEDQIIFDPKLAEVAKALEEEG